MDDGKVQEVSLIIVSLEKKLAEEELKSGDAASIKDGVLNLKRKLGLFRQLLKTYTSLPYDYRKMC